MRLLAIDPSVYDRNPSQRYRIEQWEPLLGERGVEITYRPFESRELNEVLYQPGRLATKMRLVAASLARRALALAREPGIEARCREVARAYFDLARIGGARYLKVYRRISA